MEIVVWSKFQREFLKSTIRSFAADLQEVEVNSDLGLGNYTS